MEVDMKRADSYNEEFKRDAVNLSEEHGVKTAAEKLGVSASCLLSDYILRHHPLTRYATTDYILRPRLFEG